MSLRSLSSQPKVLQAGVVAWKNTNGFASLLLHHDADPETASLEDRHVGLDENQFKREHELDFTSWKGKAVYPEFTRELHVDQGRFFNKDLPVYRGWDFGYHHPAVVYVQQQEKMVVLGELLGEDLSLEKFVRDYTQPYEEQLFHGAKFVDSADIAGRQMSDKSEQTSFAILSNFGIFPFNKKTPVAEGMALLRRYISQDGFRIHPRCRVLIQGFEGGHRYEDEKEGRPTRETPRKDGFYEHLFDALRYVVVNSGNLYLPTEKEKPKEPSRVDKILAARGRTRIDEFGMEL